MTPTGALARPLPARPMAPPAAAGFSFRGLRPAALRKLRERLIRKGEHAQALQVALEAARVDPGRESFFRLGFLYREVGRYRDSLNTLRDALRFRTGVRYLLPEIHLHLAYTWFLMGRRKRMGEALRRAYAFRVKPRTAFDFHIMLGNQHFAHQRYREACAEYVRAEAAAPDARRRGKALHNQGISLVRLCRADEARTCFERAIRILKGAKCRAELAITREMCGDLYFDMDHHRRAMEMLRRAARTFRELGKTDREAAALQGAGYVAGEMGLPAKARALLDRAIRIADGTGQWDVAACARACRAWLYFQEDGFKEGVADLSRAQELLRGRRFWRGALFLARTQARVAALFGDWVGERRAAARGERLAKKVGDLPRVIEFRRMRAGAEENLGRKRAALAARKGVERLGLVNGAASSPMQALLRSARRLAPSDLSILIIGEGADLAREIHRSSRRAAKPCVVVPCEQLKFPASDLAGHVKGAWSGAERASRGYAQHALGGTLILDRVDELSPVDQQALIPVVEGRVRAVGSAEERKLDFRIVATCGRLEGLIPGLRHRLAAAVLRIPSLKERPSDIPMFVEQFLRGRRRITCDALAELARHAWPGNLAELRSTVDRLVVFSDKSIGVKLIRRILKTPESHRLGALSRRAFSSRKTALALA